MIGFVATTRKLTGPCHSGAPSAESPLARGEVPDRRNALAGNSRAATFALGYDVHDGGCPQGPENPASDKLSSS